MKAQVTTICCLLILAACSGGQQYEKTINAYLQENLKNPGSYQNVEMGQPGKVTLMSTAFLELNLAAQAGEMPRDSVNSKLEQIKAAYTRDGLDPYQILGWTVRHKYRAANSFGAVVLQEVEYTLNPEQTKVLKVEQR